MISHFTPDGVSMAGLMAGYKHSTPIGVDLSTMKEKSNRENFFAITALWIRRTAHQSRG
jgi:hypothetical protein